MIHLLYGTTNEAKIKSMHHMLKDIDVSLLNCKSSDLSQIKISETGNSPVENACIKAEAFYNTLKVAVFSCDTGLYFKGVPHKYQPGVWVRRANGHAMTDEEMISYYADLAKKYSGQITAYYQNAICLVMGESEIYTRADETLHSEEFIISSVPHKSRVDGYPLDSLSVHIESGKFYMDLHNDEKYSYVLKKDLSVGFCRFFIDTIGAKKITNR